MDIVNTEAANFIGIVDNYNFIGNPRIEVGTWNTEPSTFVGISA